MVLGQRDQERNSKTNEHRRHGPCGPRGADFRTTPGTVFRKVVAEEIEAALMTLSEEAALSEG